MPKKQNKLVEVLIISIQRGKESTKVLITEKANSGCSNFEILGMLELASKQILSNLKIVEEN